MLGWHLETVPCAIGYLSVSVVSADFDEDRLR